MWPNKFLSCIYSSHLVVHTTLPHTVLSPNTVLVLTTPTTPHNAHQSPHPKTHVTNSLSIWPQADHTTASSSFTHQTFSHQLYPITVLLHLSIHTDAMPTIYYVRLPWLIYIKQCSVSDIQGLKKKKLITKFEVKMHSKPHNLILSLRSSSGRKLIMPQIHKSAYVKKGLV